MSKGMVVSKQGMKGKGHGKANHGMHDSLHERLPVPSLILSHSHLFSHFLSLSHSHSLSYTLSSSRFPLQRGRGKREGEEKKKERRQREWERRKR